MPRSFSQPDPDRGPRRPGSGNRPGSNSRPGVGRPNAGRNFAEQDDEDDDDGGSYNGSGSGGGSPLDKLNAYIAQKRRGARVEPQKIDPGRRLIALGIDFGVAYAISMVLVCIPFLNRFLSINIIIPIFMCGRDFLFGGRGVGKNLMGLKVVDMASGGPPSIMQAILRNAVYIAPLLILQFFDAALHLIPSHIGTGSQAFNVQPFIDPVRDVGHFALSLYVLVIVPLEAYRTYSSEDSMRLGDAIAGTCLLDSDTNFKELLPK